MEPGRVRLVLVLDSDDVAAYWIRLLALMCESQPAVSMVRAIQSRDRMERGSDVLSFYVHDRRPAMVDCISSGSCKPSD